MKVDSILETIGNTPHVRIHRLFDPRYEVWMKLERANPGGSIKDRIGLAMIDAAEASGMLGPDSVIIEPTSGNTGIGLALAAAVKGYRLILVMPESMSVERRGILAAYGAEVDLTPREQGMPGTIVRAEELRAVTPGAWIPQQFINPANVDVHQRTTAQEVLADFPEGTARSASTRRGRAGLAAGPRLRTSGEEAEVVRETPSAGMTLAQANGQCPSSATWSTA